MCSRWSHCESRRTLRGGYRGRSTASGSRGLLGDECRRHVFRYDADEEQPPAEPLAAEGHEDRCEGRCAGVTNEGKNDAGGNEDAEAQEKLSAQPAREQARRRAQLELLGMREP